MPEILVGFGLVAAVLTITALVSGLVERSPLSFPLLFLGLGFLLSEYGLGIIEIDAHAPALEIVATLTLSLVLFLDAVKLDLRELGKRWLVPFLILIPGTGLIIGLGALPIALLFGFPIVVAVIGGAVLASTDPVVLREIVRDERIPRSVRQVLKFEAGSNDILVLPVVLILIGVAQAQVGDLAGWAVFLGKLLLLGPLVGFAIGGVGAWLIAKIDAHMGIRREYQALYGVGMVLTAYVAATAVGGDGFLATFAAGIAVVLLNQTLCSCFLEYGEITSEMAMLVAFVLFGAVLAGALGSVPLAPALLLAALVVLVIRPSVLGLVLARSKMSWEAHAFVSWFGPRGLNSLLLMLIAIYAGVEGAEELFGIVGVVVLASVVVHGATAPPCVAWYARRLSRDTLAEEREDTAAGLFGHSEDTVTRIKPEDLNRLLSSLGPPVLLDVRSRSTYLHDGARIPGGVRVLPDQVIDWAADAPKDRLVVAYCT